MTLNAKFAEGGVLKKIIEAVKDLIHDAVWNFSRDGLVMNALDPSLASSISLNLMPEHFEKYHCAKNVALGMPLRSLAKILKCAANEDTLTIRFDESNADTVNVAFENSKKNYDANFDLNLLNINAESIEMPEMDFDNVITMPSSNFSDICRDLIILDDKLTISCDPAGFVIFSVKGDIQTARLT
jgi:proliferating cell nuclear antigen